MYWFRYSERSYLPLTLVLEKWPVFKETPKGVWLGAAGGPKKFVNTSWKKRFACPSIEEALQSFIARKRRQISILDHQLRRAKTALAIAQSSPRPETLEPEYELLLTGDSYEILHHPDRV